MPIQLMISPIWIITAWLRDEPPNRISVKMTFRLCALEAPALHH